MTQKSNKISARWISETRDEFRTFLAETDFPAPERIGERDPSDQGCWVLTTEEQRAAWNLPAK